MSIINKMTRQNDWQQQNSSIMINNMWQQARLLSNLILEDTHGRAISWYQWSFQN